MAAESVRSMIPRTYRKKPVIIEAVHFQKPYRTVTSFCPVLLLVKSDNNTVAFGIIDTLEGKMRADLGDWIIRGVNGEFYPCKPDIFAKTYEVAE